LSHSFLTYRAIATISPPAQSPGVSPPVPSRPSSVLSAYCPACRGAQAGPRPRPGPQGRLFELLRISLGQTSDSLPCFSAPQRLPAPSKRMPSEPQTTPHSPRRREEDSTEGT